jgi:hypothetical protein
MLLLQSVSSVRTPISCTCGRKPETRWPTTTPITSSGSFTTTKAAAGSAPMKLSVRGSSSKNICTNRAEHRETVLRLRAGLAGGSAWLTRIYYDKRTCGYLIGNHASNSSWISGMSRGQTRRQAIWGFSLWLCAGSQAVLFTVRCDRFSLVVLLVAHPTRSCPHFAINHSVLQRFYSLMVAFG